MSDQVFLEKRKEWLALRKQLEDLQEQLDLQTAAYLRSEGEAPTRKQLEQIDILLAEVFEARGELDQLILDNAN